MGLVGDSMPPPRQEVAAGRGAGPSTAATSRGRSARLIDGRPGPVHLNFSLRKPLVLDGPLPDDETGRAGGRPYVTRPKTAGGPLARAWHSCVILNER